MARIVIIGQAPGRHDLHARAGRVIDVGEVGRGRRRPGLDAGVEAEGGAAVGDVDPSTAGHEVVAGAGFAHRGAVDVALGAGDDDDVERIRVECQPALRRRRYFQGRGIRGVKDVAWLTPDGHEMTDGAWNADFVRSLGMLLPGDKASAIGDQIPVGRMGTPEEIGGICLFLASDAAGYINGATIWADGGGGF